MSRDRAASLALSLALVAVGAAAWALQLRAPLRVDAAALAALPPALGDWRARDVPLENEVEAMLRADWNLQREYARPGSPPVSLYVGYYGTARGGAPEHTPWVCYPSNGWTIESNERLDADGLRAHELVVTQNEQRRLVLFWYQSWRRAGLLGSFDVTLDHVLSRLRTERADGALVRISTDLPPGGELAARSRLVSFGGALVSALAAHWPEERAAR
jgi:EpsI family protein